MGKTIQKQAEHEGFLERLGKRIDNAGTWHKRVLAVIAIIASIVAGVTAISNNLTGALDEHISAQTAAITEQTAEITQQLQAQDVELEKIRLDTLRVQLMQYIYNDPTSHETILRLAYTYFVEYKGDWVMTDKFKEWAEQEGVNIPFDLSH